MGISQEVCLNNRDSKKKDKMDEINTRISQKDGRLGI